VVVVVFLVAASNHVCWWYKYPYQRSDARNENSERSPEAMKCSIEKYTN
jgi:hypothetical protein